MTTAKKKYPFEPDFAVAPGETLAETLTELGMSQVDLARRTGLTVQTINRIVKGSQPITFETANRLELTTGVPARFWNNLEAQYREQLAYAHEQRQLARYEDWLKKMPVRELAKRAAIRQCEKPADQVRELLGFYKVATVDAWQTTWRKGGVAARCSQSSKTKPGPTSAWLRLGEIRASEIKCDPYVKRNFKQSLEEIRNLTTKTPDVFVPRMTKLCASSGVALCLVPEMPGAPWYGASKWLTAKKAMILLGLRGKRDDQFWFSFFHEAGHILLHGKKLFLSNDSTNDPQEIEANEFASRLLIPASLRSQIPLLRSKASVRHLAEKAGVAPGIIVGQYQHLTKKFAWFNGLKRKLVWSE